MSTLTVLEPRVNQVLKQKPLGFYFRCRSQFNGAPIVVLINGFPGNRSENPKTGPMLQAWILPEEVEPHHAVRAGWDVSVCNTCRGRPACKGTHHDGAPDGFCYVCVFNAPLSAYRAYKRNRYDSISNHTLEAFSGEYLRIGAWGDPVAVPVDFWRLLLNRGHLAGHTGYTHAWKEPIAQEYKGFLMASVDTVEEYHEATSLGWKTFRTRTLDLPLLSGESRCPASAEAGHKTTCIICGACNGRRGNRTIGLHGFRVSEPARNLRFALELK